MPEVVCICTSYEVYTGDGMERAHKTSVPEPSARPPPGKEIQVTEGTLDTRIDRCPQHVGKKLLFPQ